MSITSFYRAALVGCGRIGADCGPPELGSSRIASHAQAFFEHPQVDFVAAYDLDSTALSRCGERWGVSGLYTDLSKMLEKEEVDLISIATPARTHLVLFQEVIRNQNVAGILLEKPIAATLEEAQEIIGLSRQCKAKVAVNYIRRYPPTYRDAIRVTQQGDLGNIQHVQVYYT